MNESSVMNLNPADVVAPHMADGGNPIRASSPTAGFAPDNRRRQQGLDELNVFKMGPNQYFVHVLGIYKMNPPVGGPSCYNPRSCKINNTHCLKPFIVQQ